jgi:hypothetical protein
MITSALSCTCYTCHVGATARAEVRAHFRSACAHNNIEVLTIHWFIAPLCSQSLSLLVSKSLSHFGSIAVNSLFLQHILWPCPTSPSILSIGFL